MKSDLMKEHRIPSSSSNRKTFVFLLSFLVTLISCKDGTLNIPRASDEAGADVSACLSGPAIDYERVFAGPCEIQPSDDENQGPPDPTDTISYAGLMSIVMDENPDEAEAFIEIINCVAQAAFCVGETQCLSVASICQFAVNCGSPEDPCAGGTGACNANLVSNCEDVQNKNDCNAAYMQSCFNNQGGFTDCNHPDMVAQQDYRNCYWGVDSATNQTGCFNYGSTYADGACTLSQ